MSLGIILSPYGKVPGAYPSAINYSYGGNGQFLCPPDPQYDTRGEQGFYYDTPLGGAEEATTPVEKFKAKWLAFWLKVFPPPAAPVVAPAPEPVTLTTVNTPRIFNQSAPTDFDMSSMLQYTPVTRPWVAAKEADWTGPWLPPNGWNPAGQYGPQPHMNAGYAQVPSPIAAPNQPLSGYGLGETTDEVLAALTAHNQRVFALTFVSTAAVAIAAVLGAYRTVKLLRNAK